MRGLRRSVLFLPVRPLGRTAGQSVTSDQWTVVGSRVRSISGSRHAVSRPQTVRKVSDFLRGTRAGLLAVFRNARGKRRGNYHRARPCVRIESVRFCLRFCSETRLPDGLARPSPCAVSTAVFRGLSTSSPPPARPFPEAAAETFARNPSPSPRLMVLYRPPPPPPGPFRAAAAAAAVKLAWPLHDQ